MRTIEFCTMFLIISLIFLIYRDSAIDRNELIVLSMAIKILGLLIYANRVVPRRRI